MIGSSFLESLMELNGGKSQTFIDAQQTKRALANHKYIIKDTENEISAKLIFS